jgi:glycosyltransferase involved in cell wall biosynthesis
VRVLVSAIACSPDEGSESFIGWNAVSALAKDHELWVLTSPRYREPIERAQRDGRAPQNTHFVFHGTHKVWHPNRLRARLQSWEEYVHWSKTLLPAAWKLHKEVGFNLAHHVTYCTWRVPSQLWQLPIPFVWGPVGGAGTTPLRFLPTMSFGGISFELVRIASNRLARNRALADCVMNSTTVLASNRETFDCLATLRGAREGMQIIRPGYFSEDQICRLRCAPAEKNVGGVIRLFAGGNLIGSKGVAIALRALALAKEAGVRFLYTIAGGGPEKAHLQKVVACLKLNAEVRFVPPFQGRSYVKELKKSHIYLLPSFRENIGLSMMEAMLAGCVPIVADSSAQGEIVADDCGFRVRIDSARSMVREISEIICNLNRNVDLFRTKSRAARLQISGRFTEHHYRDEISRVYHDIEASFDSCRRR